MMVHSSLRLALEKLREGRPRAFVLPDNFGRVIQVVRNSGVRNRYLILAMKKHYPKFGYPIIHVRVLLDIPEIVKTNNFEEKI